MKATSSVSWYTRWHAQEAELRCTVYATRQDKRITCANFLKAITLATKMKNKQYRTK